MFNSEIPLLKTLFPEGNPKRTSLKTPITTSTHLKISMRALMRNVHSKQLNFVKCMKPNSSCQPEVFHAELVVSQMRSLLLLESARLAKSGYFYSSDYVSFIRRFKMLSPLTWPRCMAPSALDSVSNLLKDLPIYMPHYAFGRTKLFIKHLRTVGNCRHLVRL